MLFAFCMLIVLFSVVVCVSFRVPCLVCLFCLCRLCRFVCFVCFARTVCIARFDGLVCSCFVCRVVLRSVYACCRLGDVVLVLCVSLLMCCFACFVCVGCFA